MLELIENDHELDSIYTYEDEYEDECDCENYVSVEYWNNLALLSIDLYFKNKKFHCGGKIPTNLLYSTKNVEIVRDSVRLFGEGFGIAMKAIYNILHEYSPLRHDPIVLSKPWDTMTVLKMFNEMHELHIPKEFIPGLMILNLHFCKGYNISKEIKNINKQMNDLITKLNEE